MSDKEVKEGRALFEALFQMIPDPVIITTLEEGKLVAYNDAFASFFRDKEKITLDQGTDSVDLYFELDKRELLVEKLKRNGFCENIEMEIAGADKMAEPYLCLVSCRLFKMAEKPYILCLIRDTSEIKKLEKEIRQSAITDKLTQVYNRLRMDEILEMEMDRSERTKRPFAVMMIDIDAFKTVNDTYGNRIGDAVIVECANIIKANIRSTDSVGRWSGGEFLVLLPETDQNGARVLAEKLRALIADYQFTNIGRLTASFGISAFKKDLLSAGIISRTDAAVRKAKENGGNQIGIC